MKLRLAPVLAVLLLARTSLAQEPEPLVPVAPPPTPAPAPAPGPSQLDAPPVLPPSDVALSAFAWGDFTWLNGQSRQKDFPLEAFGKAVTMSLYLDANYAFSGNHPKDNTLSGTGSLPRHNELVQNLASFGLEWNYRHPIGRVSLQYGEMLGLIQDQDGSASRGRSLSIANLKYLREAARAITSTSATG